MPSTREIANYIGVSTSTVSLALNNKEGVSKEMRQLVLEAADKLAVQNAGYHERGGRRRNRNLGESLSTLILHSSLITATDYFKELLNGIENGAAQYHMQLRLSADDPRQLNEHITNIYLSDPDLKPDGVIYLGSRHIEATVQKAIDMGLPLIQIGVPSNPDAISFVAPDEHAAGYQAAQHLLDLGHRRIAVLGHQKDTPHLVQRLAGYRKALTDRGITPEDDWVFLTDYEGEGYDREIRSIEAVTHAFIAARPSVTAVLFSNWQSSVIGLPMLQQAGYRIPQDLSVIVFDDFEHARRFTPSLTAVAYPLVQMGAKAVNMIVEHIHTPDIARMQQIFRPRLMVRQSTTPPG